MVELGYKDMVVTSSQAFAAPEGLAGGGEEGLAWRHGRRPERPRNGEEAGPIRALKSFPDAGRVRPLPAGLSLPMYRDRSRQYHARLITPSA